jgi:hypothetical protein
MANRERLISDLMAYIVLGFGLALARTGACID